MGYRIDIDHANCINCGVCMDVCPVAGPRHEPARATRRRGRRRVRRALRLDDGVPHPGRRVHRLRHLRPRVPARRRSPSLSCRSPRRWPRARVRSSGRRRRRARLDPAVGASPASRSSRSTPRRSAISSPWRTRSSGRSRGRSGGRWSTDAPAIADRAVPGGLPRRHRRRPLRRPGRPRAGTTRPTRSPRRSTRSRRSAAGSARHRASRRAAAGPWTSRSPSGRSSASPSSTASCLRSRRPRRSAAEQVAIVGGGPAGMSAAYYLARLGYGVTVIEAMPVPGGMMAIGIPEYRLPRDGPARGDRPDRRPGRRAAASTPRWVATSPSATSSARGSRPSSSPPARRRAAGWAFRATTCRRRDPGDPLPQAGQPRREARGSPARSSSSAAAAPRWTRRARRWRSGADSVTIALPPRPRRHAGPGGGDRGRRARGHHDPRPASPPTEVVGRDGRRRGAPQSSEQQPTGRLGARARRLRGRSRAASRAISPRARSSSRSARSRTRRSCPRAPASRSAAGRASWPTRAPWRRAAPAIFAGGDVVSGPKTIIDAVAAGRRAAASIHEYLAGARDGEAEIMAAVRYQDRTRADR